MNKQKIIEEGLLIHSDCTMDKMINLVRKLFIERLSKYFYSKPLKFISSDSDALELYNVKSKSSSMIYNSYSSVFLPFEIFKEDYIKNIESMIYKAIIELDLDLNNKNINIYNSIIEPYVLYNFSESNNNSKGFLFQLVLRK